MLDFVAYMSMLAALTLLAFQPVLMG